MNRFLHGVVKSITEVFPLPEPILEIGSFQVTGQDEFSNLRSLFPRRQYVGLDIREGPGVDVVGSVEDLPQQDGSIGTVLAICTFEHVKHFWKGFQEIYRVLRPDGVLLVACPFYFHIHAYPSDYWRFTPQSLELMLEEYPHKLIGYHGPKTRPGQVWGLAFRDRNRVITKPDFERYEDALRRYARQPLPWTRRARYQVGRLLCGRRTFAPYLDRERWNTWSVSLT